MRSLCRRYKLHYCDLLGHPIDAVAKVAGTPARMEPGARPVLDSTYFKRMAAIEFAVRFDDGIATYGLRDADIVLVGVSRSSKTPLSIYLGYLGYRTANVPIVKGIEPPKELFELERARVVGLTIDALTLAEIRGERARNIRGPRREYAGLEAIYEELEYAECSSPAARLSRPRGVEPRDRGDRASDRSARRAAVARPADGEGGTRVSGSTALRGSPTLGGSSSPPEDSGSPQPFDRPSGDDFRTIACRLR